MLSIRWLVVLMATTVIAVGALAYWQEIGRADQALSDFGVEQVSVARAAALLLAESRAPASLAALEQPRMLRVLVAHDGAVRTLAGKLVAMPAVSAARGETIVRIDPDAAATLDLPRRTAIAGVVELADGGRLAVVASAERLRDRARSAKQRLVVSLLVVTAVVSAFGGLALRRQRTQLELVAQRKDATLEKLSRTATMAMLGSGVAHEMSTPLGVIVGRAEQIVARASGDERIAKNAQGILEQAEHIDRVVRGLLGLARGAPIALRDVAPAKLVADATALVEHRFERAGVRLATELALDVPAVRCEPLLLQHAIVNLLLNACDASPAGGEVRFAVRADGADVVFDVLDDGHGITDEDAARAVEPFFTTKPEGEGTGLGLAIAQEIARTHRGTLELAARTPRGTRATIRVPGDASDG